MRKPDSLRAWLSGAIPSLKADPDRLQIFIEKGGLRSTGVPGVSGTLGVEYSYTCQLLLLDFAGDPDGVFIALIAWISTNQPELLQNFDRNRQGIAFECDILDGQKVDLQITLELTEAVLASARTEGGYDVIHPEEAAQVGLEPWATGPNTPPLIGSLYANGELIAELPVV